MISHSSLTSYTPSRVFLIQGREDTLTTLSNELEEAEIPTILFSVPSLTIETAKEIRTTINDYSAVESWILISFSFFTKDAGDVFLKVLEEPHDGVHIVLCTPYPYLVPDTIRSRVLFLVSTENELSHETFFTFSVSEKLEYIKKHFGTDADDDAPVRKKEAFALLDEYERVLHNSKRFSQATLLYDAKQMIVRAGIPPKQVLEYVVSMLG